MKNKQPRVLFFDIETSPNVSWTWGKWQQDVIEFKEEWYMLSFAYKWLGDKTVKGYKLNDFKLYKKDKKNDYKLCKKLWELLNEADVVIGHNSLNFDIPKTNARFLFHGFTPYSPIKNIDTKRIAKQYFKFNSNSLNDIGQHLQLGEKLKHSGFSLWKGCMIGDIKCWNNMLKYNKQDVILLEKIYLKFLPYITNHPNWGLYTRQEYCCPNCGSRHVQRRGYNYTKTLIYQKYQCMACGAWSSNKKCEKGVINPMLKN